jgi:hypothetical protein
LGAIRGKEVSVNKGKKLRIAGIAAVFALVLVVLKAANSFRRFSYVERDFDSVQVGQSRAIVVAKLGKPNYHDGQCLTDLGARSDCATELVYSHPFAPWLPEYYVVELSPDGHVISAEHLISP